MPDPTANWTETYDGLTPEEFATYLDPHETSDEHSSDGPTDHQSTPADPAELSFRHSGWQQRREATKLALGAAGSSPSTSTRFANCGAVAWVMQDPKNPAHVRVQCERCRNRWCEACAREKRILVQINLANHLPNTRLRFMTLTLKSNDLPPGDAVSRLYTCFRRLRQRRKLQTRLIGGLAFLELTYTTERGQFHPHLHIIYEGHYIPHQLLRNEWFAVTGDSFIVDVREIKRPAIAIGYVTKYAGKCIGKSIWQDHAVLTAVILGLQGRRTLFTFGKWKGFKLLTAPDSDTDWKTVGKLTAIIAKANAGDADAKAILNALRRYTPGPEHADPETMLADT